jgi:hypothetical protein
MSQALVLVLWLVGLTGVAAWSQDTVSEPPSYRM